MEGINTMTKSVAILGASGYTGAELVRLIATHPSMKITALSGNAKAGMAMSEVYPHLRHIDLPRLTTIGVLRAATCHIAAGDCGPAICGEGR